MIDSNFKTRVVVDDAKYDSENQMILVYVTVALTGEQKILSESKSQFKVGDGKEGDFPDELMLERVNVWKSIIGKTITWELISESETKK